MSEPKTTEDIVAETRKALTEHEEAIGKHTIEATKLRLMLAAMGALDTPVQALPVLPSPPWPPTQPFPYPPIRPLDIYPMPVVTPFVPLSPWAPTTPVIGHGGNCACGQCCPVITCAGQTFELTDPIVVKFNKIDCGQSFLATNTIDYRGVQQNFLLS